MNTCEEHDNVVVVYSKPGNCPFCDTVDELKQVTDDLESADEEIKELKQELKDHE